MKISEKSAKTIDEAVEACLLELGIKKDQGIIEILEQPGKIVFGLFGNRLAKVRVSYQDDPGKIACQFLKDLISSMSVKAEYEILNQDGNTVINITGTDLGILIGRRGDTLEALQFITNLAVARKIADKSRIIIDVEGYRKRREETLINLAKRLADRVKKSGNRVVLEPMSPQERRIIHTALQNEWKVSTFSEGEGSNRKVVISLKGNNKDVS